MKLSTFIKNLNKIQEMYGDFECYYSTDDEDNDYKPVYFKPVLMFINKDNKVFKDLENVEDYGLTAEDVETICLIN